MNYNFIVNNEIIRGRPDLKLYTGNTGTYTFEFEFDEQWADLQIFVTFTGNSGTYVSKAENNRVTVPRELLINPGSCRFGVYGTNSSDDIKRMSSNLIELEVVQGAYSDGTAPAVPTPDLWEVLVTKTVPIIGENGNWWIWSMEEQGYIDSGVYASQKYDDTEVRQAIEDINSGKVDKIDGKALSANDFTDNDKAKLNSLENYDDTEILQSVSALEEQKADRTELPSKVSELENDANYVVNGTIPNYNRFGVVKTNQNFGINASSDGTLYTIPATYPEISSRDDKGGYKVITPTNIEYAVKSVGDGYYADKAETVEQIGNKVDKVTGKGLSTNDYDNTAKKKSDAFPTCTVSQMNHTVGEIPIKDGMYFVTDMNPAGYVIQYSYTAGMLMYLTCIQFRITSSGIYFRKGDDMQSAVWTRLDLRENEKTYNKVTELSEYSTDEEYPSALAVKSYVDNAQPDLSGYMKTDKYVTELLGFNGGLGAKADAGGAIGDTACTSNGGAVGMNTKSFLGGAVGSYATTVDGFSGGEDSHSQEGGAVGRCAEAGDGFSGGYNAKAATVGGKRIDAIQLGTGTNSEAKTLQIYGYKLMNSDGTIPDERIPGLKPAVITSITDNTLLLNNNQDARLGEMTELILTMPESIPEIYESCFSFASGSTATVLICSGTPLIWRGDDVDSEGIFTPEANTVYEVNIKNLGINGIVARVGAV